MTTKLLTTALTLLLTLPALATESVTDALSKYPGPNVTRVAISGEVTAVHLAAHRGEDGKLLVPDERLHDGYVSDPVRVYLSVEGSKVDVLCPTEWVAVERPVDCRTVTPGVEIEARGVLHEDHRLPGSPLVLDPFIIQEAELGVFMGEGGEKRE